jgi:Na+-transporting NADH:ubiquinone oxidoreductase subunit C
MAKEKRAFSETRIYPIIFMVIVTVIFVGLLSTFYQITISRVTAYKKMQLQESVLSIFNLPASDVQQNFDKYIVTKEIKGIKYFVAHKDSVLLGYCFPIRGKGLWGSIEALLGLSADLKQILKLQIINQNETPGLGGRITENWFQRQFQNKIVIEDEILLTFQLVPEEEQTSNQQINQITGATASSKAVVNMISQNVKKILEQTGAEL